MKRKRSINKSVLTICLVVMLILQAVTFSTPAYAESAPVDPEPVIISEADSPSATELPVTESLQLIPAYSITMMSNSNASENGWINLAGNVEGAIEWQVNIDAMDDISLPLAGLKFYDALDSVEIGTYVEGSFKVNGVAATPDRDTTNALAYTFPSGFGDKATITFKTWIPKEKYYREYNAGDSGWQTVTNTAELRDASDNKLISSNLWRVAIKPDWIQMYGTFNKRANPADPLTITWTIDVNKNYNKQGLKDFTITDALLVGLTFKSADYQLWDSGSRDWSVTKTPITPVANNVYAFGEVNGPIRLVILSEVSGSATSFYNKAITHWKLDVNTVQDNGNATVWDTATVTNQSPVIQAFQINNGDAFTSSRNVNLNVVFRPAEASPPVQISISDNEYGPFLSWNDVQSPIDWTLPAGDGIKTVHAQFRDVAGNISQRSTSITLDTTPPVITGVLNGQKYKTYVTPTFTDATLTTAILNGFPFTSGTTITQEGHYTLIVTDAAGNSTTIQFAIDKTPFAGTIQINQGSGYTNGTNVTLNLTVTELRGVRMAFSNDGVTWSPLEPYSATKQWQLSSDEGNKTVHVKFLDDEDNEDIQTSNVVLDQTKPTGTFQINNGAVFTNSRTVELDTIYSDNLSPVEMSISSDNLIWSLWEAAQSKRTVTLSAEDGVKTVYMKLRDLAGNEQAVGSATIHLDTMPPIIDLRINDGESVTTSRQVMLHMFASDASLPLEYRLANEDDDWTSWGVISRPNSNWELTTGDGVKTIKLEVRDPAGNVAAISKTITLNSAEPVVTGVVDGGIYNSDVVISFNKGTATLNGAPFANNTTVSQEGLHKLIVTYIAGIETVVNFTIDKTAPSGSFTINNGAATTSSNRVNLSITATDNLGQIQMRIANENEAWSNWQAYTPALTWTLPNGNGPKRVLLELRDEAGNIGIASASITLFMEVPVVSVPDSPIIESRPTPKPPEKPDQPIEGEKDSEEPGAEVITFTDILGHWAESYIKRAVSFGIINGNTDGTFKPDAAITRAEFTVMLMRMLKPEGQVAELSFVDESIIGSWAKKEIAYAVKAKIVSGYSDGYFRPNAAISRTEMIVMIARALGLPIDNDAKTDDSNIPQWAKGAVEALRRSGLMQELSGKPYTPDASVTRAEAVKMIIEVMQTEVR